MKDEEKPKKPDPVNEIKLALRAWAQNETDKERQEGIDALLTDAGVKPQPAQPDEDS